MYQGQPENAVKTYREFLAMSWDRAERCQAMINLSRCDPENAISWLKTAAIESPQHREPLVELAQLFYTSADWVNCLKYAKKALDITNHPMDYTCTPEAWGSQPWDLASIAAWNMKLYQDSLDYAKKAVELNPDDQRLRTNVETIDLFITENII